MSPQDRRRRLLLALPAVAYAALILFLSSRPASQLPSTGVPSGDKVLHLAEYFVFGALLVWPVLGWTWRGRGVALAAGIAYGAFDEAFQTLIPGRIGDVGDFAVDALGVALAVALSVVVHPEPTAAKAR